MPIDPSAVQWDAINPSAVQWDQSPADFQRADAQATSIPQAMTIGAGRMSDRLWEGVKQGGYGVGAILSELLPDRLKQVAQDALAQKLLAQQNQQADNTARYKPLADAHPVATTVGEAIPLAASPMLRVADGAGALASAVNAGTSAALPSMVEYGTAGERAERGAGAAIGGAVGSGLVSAGAKVLKPVQTLLTPEQQRLAQVAEDAGINLTAGDKTGNKFMKTTEAVLQEMPSTAGAQQALAQGKREAFTRAVMNQVGDAATDASPQQLATSRARIGGDFDRIFSKVNVPIDTPQTQQALSAIVQDANATLPGDTAKVVANRISQLIDKVDENGNVPGKAYQAWRTEVQQQAAGSGNSWLTQKLRDVYRSVDQVAYDAANQVGEAENLTAARGQYRNLLAVEDAMKLATDGNVPAGRFLGSANRFGTEDAKDLARAGRAFVADQVPNSGTAQRAVAQAMLSGGLGMGVGGVTYGLTQDPMQALKMGSMAAAGRLVIPKAAQTLINSGPGQSYLTNGIGRQLTPLEEALMERAVRLGALSGERGLVGQ